MVNEELPSIKSDRKVKNLKATIADFKSGGSKKLRLPSKVWKKVAELAEVYPASALASELELAESTFHKKVKMYGKKSHASRTSVKSRLQTENPIKLDNNQEAQAINLIELPREMPDRPLEKTEKEASEKIIAEITNRNGTTVRIFSGIDHESLKLLTSMA